MIRAPTLKDRHRTISGTTESIEKTTERKKG